MASPVNIFLNWLLIWYETVSFGFIGAPIATSISFWIMLLLIIGYIHFVDGSRAWGGWSIESLYGWWSFPPLAVPGILMVCTEFWAVEIGALAASYLGTVSLASQSIILITTIATFHVPMGISIAASNRIGKLPWCKCTRLRKFPCFGGPRFCRDRRFNRWTYTIIAAEWLGITLYFQYGRRGHHLGHRASLCPFSNFGRDLGRVQWDYSWYGPPKGGSLPQPASLLYLCHSTRFLARVQAQPRLGHEGLWVGLCVALVIISSGQSVFLYFCRLES